MVVTSEMLNRKREKDCIGITAEKKYYRVHQTFVKRSLRPEEWQVSAWHGRMLVPRQGRDRMLNEAASLQFIAENTNIPVPKLHCCFEDDDAIYVITEYIEGVGMDTLDDRQRKVVELELQQHLASLSRLRSSTMGGPSGVVAVPYRIIRLTARESWKLKTSDHDEFVFCHNDLSMNNVIVDPQTLKIQALVDWEYSGYYPARFEARFYNRLGPSVALDGEEDDAPSLLALLESYIDDCVSEPVRT